MALDVTASRFYIEFYNLRSYSRVPDAEGPQRRPPKTNPRQQRCGFHAAALNKLALQVLRQFPFADMLAGPLKVRTGPCSSASAT
jgi:hypothetical protein